MLLTLTIATLTMTGNKAHAQSCQPGGTYYVTSTSSPIWFGKLDTMGSSGTDTIMVPIGCKPQSITFQDDFYKVSGSPVVTVNLYTSSNGGITYCTTAITSFTVAPTSTSLNVTPAQYIVNTGFGGDPYTNYMWTYANSASTTLSHKSYITVR